MGDPGCHFAQLVIFPAWMSFVSVSMSSEMSEVVALMLSLSI